ncbi:MAG: hypothetical protein HYS43_01970 [Candidatus Liptonbacteria bacterium]|nr:hypothetical protein [Candidatus Liptonbacteria bacterium]
MKKFIYTLLVLGGLAALGFGAYSLVRYLSPSAQVPAGAVPPISQAGQPGTATSSTIFLVFPDPIFDYAFREGNTYVAIRPDGTLVETDIGSDLKRDLTENAVDGMAKAAAARDATRILVSFRNGSAARMQFSVYDMIGNAWLPLPAGIVSAAWSPADSDRIAYIKETDGSSVIGILTLKTATSTDAGAGALASFADASVMTLSAADLVLDWVNADNLFLSSKPSAAIPGELWMLSLAKKTLRRIADGPGLAAQWSADGDYGIIFSSDADALMLTDNFAQPLLALPFLTIPDKCAIRSRRLYCAVPRQSIADANLPDAYYQRELYFRDDIYGIDLRTGKSTLLLDGAQFPVDAVHLRQNGDYLFLKNRLDEKMYAVLLPSAFAPEESEPTQ